MADAAEEFAAADWSVLPDTLRAEAHTALACAVQAATATAAFTRR